MPDDDSPTIAPVPSQARDRLGRAHQLRVDIAIAIATAAPWLRRALGDRDGMKARAARADLVERIAGAIERRFRVTWIGGGQEDADARPPEEIAPLFGGPGRQAPQDDVDGKMP